MELLEEAGVEDELADPSEGAYASVDVEVGPPERGRAVASSLLHRAAGSKTKAEMKYARARPAPDLATAMPGRTKIPDPSMAPWRWP